MKKVVGVIPARWGATRFPGKILALLKDKPLVQWVYERAVQAARLDEVIIATDDRRIKKCAESFGASVVMTRSDHPSGTDRVAEALHVTDAEVVVNIQGDEPLIEPELIDALANALLGEVTWDMSTACAPVQSVQELSSSSAVKVVVDEAGKALYFSRSVIPFDRDEKEDRLDARNVYWRHVGIYGYQRSALAFLQSKPPCMLEQVEKLEQLRALFYGLRIKVVKAKKAHVGVDTPDDLHQLESVLQDIRL